MYTVWYVYPRPIFRFLCLNFPKRWGGGPTPSPPNFLYIHVRASLLIINETKSKKHIMNTNRYINIYWHIEVLIILHWTYLNFDFPSKGWERKSCLWKEFIKTTIIVLVYTLDLTCMTRWKFSLNGQNQIPVLVIMTGNTFMYICGVIELCGLKKIQTYFCTQSETNPVHLSYLKMRFTAKFLCRNNT